MLTKKEGTVDEKKDMMGKYHKHEVEDALRSLTKAEEIKSDKSLMAQVQKLASKHKKHISSIADLKAKRDELAKEEGEEADTPDNMGEDESEDNFPKA